MVHFALVIYFYPLSHLSIMQIYRSSLHTFMYVLLSVFLHLHLRDLTETEMISKIQMQNKTNDFELNT